MKKKKKKSLFQIRWWAGTFKEIDCLVFSSCVEVCYVFSCESGYYPLELIQKMSHSGCLQASRWLASALSVAQKHEAVVYTNILHPAGLAKPFRAHGY